MTSTRPLRSSPHTQPLQPADFPPAGGPAPPPRRKALPGMAAMEFRWAEIPTTASSSSSSSDCSCGQPGGPGPGRVPPAPRRKSGSAATAACHGGPQRLPEAEGTRGLPPPARRPGSASRSPWGRCSTRLPARQGVSWIPMTFVQTQGDLSILACRKRGHRAPLRRNTGCRRWRPAPPATRKASRRSAVRGKSVHPPLH